MLSSHSLEYYNIQSAEKSSDETETYIETYIETYMLDVLRICSCFWFYQPWPVQNWGKKTFLYSFTTIGQIAHGESWYKYISFIQSQKVFAIIMVRSCDTVQFGQVFVSIEN